MRPWRSAVASCALASLVGCITYASTAPLDPVKALRTPVVLEDLSRIAGDSGLIRVRLRVRAPRDTAIVLMLSERGPVQQRDTIQRRPAIMLRVVGDSAAPGRRLDTRLLLAGHNAPLVPDGERTISAGQEDHVNLVMTSAGQLPARFVLDMTWYMRPNIPVGTTAQLIERRDDQPREARVTRVPVIPVLAAAVGSIVLFFIITTR